MPASNPLDILLAHNLWATRQLLDACAKLSADQFHRRFEMGPGSLHDTTSHMIWAMQRWADFLAKREVHPISDAKQTPQELIAMLDRVAAEFAALAKSHPLDEVVAGERRGKTYTFTRGSVITHVTTHTMHHRAQCLNMLRQLGVNPLPMSSVLEWMLTVDNVQ